MSIDPHSLDTHSVFARTIWGEARGEGQSGMEAVASVMLNRAAHPGWWGTDVKSVCLAPWQFSCWLVSDPNREKMLAVDVSDPEFAIASDIAARALAGELADGTGGADSYVNLAVDQPHWIESAHQTCVIGHHTFYITRV